MGAADRRRVGRVARAAAIAAARAAAARLRTVLAVALGVALGAAVGLVNTPRSRSSGRRPSGWSARPMWSCAGRAKGFRKNCSPTLARDPGVRIASPVLELDAALPGIAIALKILGVDPFRAGALQPALIGDLGPNLSICSRRTPFFLSARGRGNLDLKRGERCQVVVGSTPSSLRVVGVLRPAPMASRSGHGHRLGAVDVRSVIGVLNRIDLG
jgi:putative ABC transport system permease protein